MADQNNLKFRITAVDLTRKVFRGISRSLNVARKALLSFKTAVIGVAGAAGLGLLVKSSLDSIDRISKLSRTLGISVKDLRRLELAADLSGVQLETLARGVRTLNKGMVDFVEEGTGEAADAFERLGLSADDVSSVMGDQFKVLQLVAQRLDKVENSATRSSIAQELFGGRASELLIVLENGGKELAKISKEAELFGLTLSNQAARGVEEANDSFTRLFSVFKGLRDTVIAGLAPAMTKLVDSFRDFILLEIDKKFGGIENAGREMALSIIEFLKNASMAFVGFGNKVINSINTMRQGFFNLKNVFSNSIDEKEFQQKIDKVIQNLDFFADGAIEKGGKYAEAMRAALDATQPLRDGTAKTKDEILKIKDALQGVLDEFGGYASGVQTSIFALQGLADASGNLQQSFTPLGRITLETGGFFDSLSDSVKGAKEETDSLTESVKACTGEIVDLDDVFEPAKDGLKDYADQAKRVKENLRQVALDGVKSLEDSLVGVIAGTKSAKEAFRDMARSIVNDLIRIQIQRSITGPLAAALGGFMPGPEPTLSVKAMGGHVAANRPYIVGERGPELMIPGASGTIIPNNKMGGNGVTVNQTINISTGVAQTVRAEIIQMMPQITETTKAAVVDARRRGGSFAAAF